MHIHDVKSIRGLQKGLAGGVGGKKGQNFTKTETHLSFFWYLEHSREVAVKKSVSRALRFSAPPTGLIWIDSFSTILTLFRLHFGLISDSFCHFAPQEPKWPLWQAKVLATLAWEEYPCANLLFPPTPTQPLWILLIKSGGIEMGEAFLLTVGAFLLTVGLLCLQSIEVLLRHTSHCKQRSSTVSKTARIVSKKAPKL